MGKAGRSGACDGGTYSENHLRKEQRMKLYEEKAGQKCSKKTIDMIKYRRAEIGQINEAPFWI